MAANSINPLTIIKNLRNNFYLIITLTKREILGRYQGSHFGIIWSLINPLLFLGVYTFVFGSVFKATWASGSGNKAEFALILFSGLLIFNLFAEIATKAPHLITQNANYVKKVIFPLDILVWPPILSAIFHLITGLLVWLSLYLIVFQSLPPKTALLFPIALLPVILMLTGLCWILASIGVYIRDISQFIGPVVTMTMFMSPIFYAKSALPERFQPIFDLNPLTIPIEATRDLLIWGQTPDLQILTGYTLGSLIFSAIGFAWFQKTRNGFADVL